MLPDYYPRGYLILERGAGSGVWGVGCGVWGVGIKNLITDY
ncbi:hypothetical protein O53_595 [Microcystis aeruginosa TAIHU98]|uniref:Uncharacterized protein n=1 Tax=Microcystis aeruginosa TAIHU98 TaxID=1134457 RepID=L7EAT6_MICAE|nr:hypothetical protein O53_595 [Microcystis aeruginosa TAIHU98]ODV38275.1 hypothetical protein BFG60_2232 [Microcystis aeruginosa NIES-98]